MPKTLRKYRYKRPFGPYIMQTTMSQEMIDILLGAGTLIRKSKKLKKERDFRKKLAGNLSEEYALTIDKKTFTAKEWEIIKHNHSLNVGKSRYKSKFRSARR